MKRKIINNEGRFFRVELTDKDCLEFFDHPERVAQSVETEFHPSTFIQFINNGLGTRFALMRKKDGEN